MDKCCCFCFTNELCMRLNRDDEFVLSATLIHLRLKYAGIHDKVCTKCLKYLKILSHFVRNYFSINSTFTACLTKKKLAASTRHVDTYSPLMDWFNVDSLISSKVINECVIDKAISSNGVLHGALAKRPEILCNHDTISRMQCKWKMIAMKNSNVCKTEESYKFIEDENFPEENKMNFHVNRKSDATSDVSFKKTHIVKTDTWNYNAGQTIACALCNRSFDTEGGMEAHLMRSHASEKKPFQCAIYEKSFNQIDCWQTHLFYHINGKRRHCTICKQSLIWNDSLKASLSLSHADEKPYKCTICKKPFRQASHLTSHLGYHTKEKPYHCSICKKSFKCASKVMIHLRSHTNDRPFHCTVCKKSFKTQSVLNVHLWTHRVEKPYKCTICKGSYRHLYSLNIHLRCHSNEKKSFQCTICTKSYSLKGSLRNHLLMHSIKNPYVCTICEKTFCKRSHLTSHLRSHSNEKPFQCTICSKSFSHKCSLKSHLWSHTQKKPHQCTVCQRSFGRTSELEIHFRTHTNEKPFHCAVCSKSFSRPNSLQVHLWTHDNIRPYPCTICEKSFSRRDRLRTHLQSHIKVEP